MKMENMFGSVLKSRSTPRPLRRNILTSKTALNFNQKMKIKKNGW